MQLLLWTTPVQSAAGVSWPLTDAIAMNQGRMRPVPELVRTQNLADAMIKTGPISTQKLVARIHINWWGIETVQGQNE